MNKKLRSASIKFFTFILLASYPIVLLAQPEENGKRYLTLVDCYQLALTRSEVLAMKQEDIEETEAQFLQAMSQALGDVNFVISNTRQEVQKADSSSSLGNTFTAASRRERKLTISQPLFQGFKALGAITGAGNLTGQREAELVRARELLFMDVAGAFYGVLQSKRNIEIRQDTRKLLEERVVELKEREKIGRSRSSEVANANSKFKTAEADWAHARRMLAVNLHVLEFLIGFSIEADQLIAETVPAPRNGWTLSDYLKGAKQRSDVIAAKQSVKTYWKNLIVAQSSLWPKITLDSNQYEKREGFQSGIDWDMLFTIDIPLFQGFEASGKIKEAVSQLKKTKLSQALSFREAELDIRQSYENWVYSVEELKALEQAANASEQNYILQKEDYERNLVNNLDVLEALESLNQARIGSNESYYETKQNFWNLQVAAGNLQKALDSQ